MIIGTIFVIAGLIFFLGAYMQMIARDNLQMCLNIFAGAANMFAGIVYLLKA